MTLYIIATPIGNLADISQRARDTLKQVDLILAEDTRRISKLLHHYQINAKIDSFHAHSDERKINQILNRAARDQKIALVTDAGTPVISDPGARLIKAVIQQNDQAKIIPIPGPSAITAALSVSGFAADQFIFRGYPPKKSGRRRKFFQKITQSPATQVWFSTPHKIADDLLLIKQSVAPDRQFCVGREMTKIHETFYRGSIDQIIEQITSDPLKGEFTGVISAHK